MRLRPGAFGGSGAVKVGNAQVNSADPRQDRCYVPTVTTDRETAL